MPGVDNGSEVLTLTPAEAEGGARRGRMDAELLTIGRIQRELDDLPGTDARRRVLNYLADRNALPPLPDDEEA